MNAIADLSGSGCGPTEEEGVDMQFQLVYTNAGYHARLFNERGELIFWTREYDYKQEVIDL